MRVVTTSVTKGLPRRDNLGTLDAGVGVGDEVVSPQFDEALVEGVGDDIVIVVAREEGAIEEGLDLDGGAHAPELEVPQPQFPM